MLQRGKSVWGCHLEVGSQITCWYCVHMNLDCGLVHILGHQASMVPLAWGPMQLLESRIGGGVGSQASTCAGQPLHRSVHVLKFRLGW